MIKNQQNINKIDETDSDNPVNDDYMNRDQILDEGEDANGDNL